MCRRTLFLIFLVLVLGGASHTWAGQYPVAHYEFEGINDFSNTGTSAAITGEPKGNAQIIWDDDRGQYVLSLAADGDYVYCERSWSGIVATEMTVMAWIKTSSVGSVDSIVALGYAWRLRSGSGGNVAFQVMNTSPVAAAMGTIPVDDGTPKNFLNGLIDDVRIYDRVLSEEEIREITAIVAVLDGTAYAGPLDLGQTYYWRVNEVNEAQTPTMLQGDLWSFATPGYLIVGNFEDYNDYPPHEIWTTWVDGYYDSANGALAGNADPPFAETTIVHGGEQSMPLFYENNFKYSEAEQTLSPPQDWTKNGVKALLINFYGNPDNTVEQMYVKLNGSGTMSSAAITMTRLRIGRCRPGRIPWRLPTERTVRCLTLS